MGRITDDGIFIPDSDDHDPEDAEQLALLDWSEATRGDEDNLGGDDT